MDIRGIRTQNNAVVSVHFGAQVTTNIWWEYGWYTITNQEVIEKLRYLQRLNRRSIYEDRAVAAYVDDLRTSYRVQEIGTPYRRDRWSHSNHATYTGERPATATASQPVEPVAAYQAPDTVTADMLEYGTSNTLSRLADIKNHTIGVEVEMYHITREKACRAVAEFFGTENTVYDSGDGYSSWYCEDTQGRKWRFMSDGSLVSDGYGTCEMTTPILKYDDIPLLQAVIRQLRSKGAKSDPNHECGVHVHIGAATLSTCALYNLSNIMYNYEHLLANALQIDSDRTSRWCRFMDPDYYAQLNDRYTESMSRNSLLDIWYHSQGYSRSTEHYNSTRYHILNLHATNTKNTVEFRIFQFNEASNGRQNGLHAGELKSYIQLCCALVSYATYVGTNHNSIVGNTRNYTKSKMNEWLFSLGMVGDEFATAREILTRNLAD